MENRRRTRHLETRHTRSRSQRHTRYQHLRGVPCESYTDTDTSTGFGTWDRADLTPKVRSAIQRIAVSPSTGMIIGQWSECEPTAVASTSSTCSQAHLTGVPACPSVRIVGNLLRTSRANDPAAPIAAWTATGAPAGLEAHFVDLEGILLGAEPPHMSWKPMSRLSPTTAGSMMTKKPSI